MRRYNPVERLCKATGYSLSGLRCAFKEEQAFEYEAVVFCVLLGLAFRLPWGHALLLLGCWLAVMAMELVNGAVERAFDLIDKEYNRQIKAGKDMLSAAVFLLIAFNVLLWACLCLHHLGWGFPD